jgi:diphosphomevalonate decarboxylase
MKTVMAKANANVALAKYWGKRDELLNLPYTGSISIALAGLESRASVAFVPASPADRVSLNGKPSDGPDAQRISRFLDLVRRQAGLSARAVVDVHSNFPVAAGLASSASTFAALALAAAHAAGLSLSPQELSVLARRGSGSAARSIFSGYVEWLPGEAPDGSDSHALQLAAPLHWPLGVVVAVTAEGPKAVGSTEGMARAVKQSPFFPAWLQAHEVDLEAIRQGILERDLALVGHAAERNCLAMHAVALTARPPILYWNPATIAVVERVRALREEGLDAYFTIDAGPQVKVICPMAQRAAVAAALGAVAGVQRVLLSEPGAGAALVEAG